MSSDKKPDIQEKPKGRFSRRGFLQGVGIGGGAVGAGLAEGAQQAPAAKTVGPGAVPITLQVNGKPYNLTVEPRVTLLDALRENLHMTGAKRVCDRGTCGACTVMLGGKAVYACSVLAVDAQGKEIQTIEGISTGAKPHPVVTAFVNNDALQCGYCTPGFVMATKALLEKAGTPTPDQVRDGLGGNLCRCGTYVGIRKAVAEAAREMKGGRNA